MPVVRLASRLVIKVIKLFGWIYSTCSRFINNWSRPPLPGLKGSFMFYDDIYYDRIALDGR